MSHHPRPKFTYLGHATVRCDLPGGEVMLIDPWLDGNPSAPMAAGDVDRADAILVTHAHGDHLGDTVALAKRLRPSKVVANYEICSWLSKQGVENCSGMNLGGAQEVLGWKVTMVRADHSSGLPDGGYGGIASGYVLSHPEGFTFYHAGDTALFSDLQLIGELYRPELSFLPIGDFFTMDPRQAARACRYLGSRKVIPIHWGTFDALTGTPDQLARELESMGTACEMIHLKPGESY